MIGGALSRPFSPTTAGVAAASVSAAQIELPSGPEVPVPVGHAGFAPNSRPWNHDACVGRIAGVANTSVRIQPTEIGLVTGVVRPGTLTMTPAGDTSGAAPVGSALRRITPYVSGVEPLRSPAQW